MCESLKEAVRSLHATLVDGIWKDETLAQECAELAYTAEQDGNRNFAAALRLRCRHHRIRALELLGRAAALNAEYGDLLAPPTG